MYEEIKEKSQILKDNDNNDDNDPVVQEIPVILCQDLSSQLCLVQYPLRPPWRPYDPKSLQEIRFKPTRQILEMDYTIPDFDVKEYRTISLSDLKETTTTGTLPRKLGLRSSTVPLKTNYLIGLYRGSEMFVTPLQAVYQMRPSFRHLDEKDERKKLNEEETQKAETEKDEEEDNEEAELRPIKMRVKRQESEKIIAMRQQSYQYLKKLEEDEPWIKLHFVNKDKLEAMEMWERLTSNFRSPIPFDIKRHEFLSVINPIPAPLPPPDKTHPKGRKVQEGLSMDTIRKLPLDKQIPAILANVQIIKFEQLFRVSTAETREQLLTEVQKCAVLVQGLWILRSEYCVTGRMIAVRNFILHQYALGEPGLCLERKFLIEKTKASSEALKEILSRICVLKPGYGWCLKREPDREFLDNYVLIAKKFHEFWINNTMNIERALNDTSPQEPNNSDADTKAKTRINGTPKSKKQRTEKQSTTGQTAATTAPIANSTTNNTNTTAVVVSDSSLTTLNPSENSFPETEESKELKEFFIGMFKKYGVCSILFLKQHFNKKLKEGGFKYVGKVSDDTFLSSLVSVASTLHNAWFLKSVQDPEVDKYRNVILDVFRVQGVSIRRADINAACKQRPDIGKVIPQSIFTKVMQELAYCKNHTWIFKSGNAQEEMR
jgi:hypothetical protein